MVDFDLTLLKTAPLSFDTPCFDKSNAIAQVSDHFPRLADQAADHKLPEHVNVLFLSTVEENNLPEDVARDLKTLLHDHQETFAKSTTDLGFCSFLNTTMPDA